MQITPLLKLLLILHAIAVFLSIALVKGWLLNAAFFIPYVARRAKDAIRSRFRAVRVWMSLRSKPRNLVIDDRYWRWGPEHFDDVA